MLGRLLQEVRGLLELVFASRRRRRRRRRRRARGAARRRGASWRPSASSSSVAENSRVCWWASGSPCGGVALSSSGSAYGRVVRGRRLGGHGLTVVGGRLRVVVVERLVVVGRRRLVERRRLVVRVEPAAGAPSAGSSSGASRRTGPSASASSRGDLGRVGTPTALEIEVLPDGVIQQAHGRLSVTSAGAGRRGVRRAQRPSARADRAVLAGALGLVERLVGGRDQAADIAGGDRQRRGAEAGGHAQRLGALVAEDRQPQRLDPLAHALGEVVRALQIRTGSTTASSSPP